MRSALVVLLSLATGCQTTGGKVFGTAGLASGMASAYLLASSGSTIEGHQLVTHDDRRDAGVGLMFGAVIAAGGWAISELMFGPRSIGGGGGGGFAPAAEPALPAAEPPPPPADEPPPPPAVEAPPPPAEAPPPPAEAPPAAGPPIVILAPDRHAGGQGRPRGGWRLDPQDRLDRLYGPDGELRGWLNPEGYVWYRTGGAAIGRVDVTPRCGPACRHTQARQLLDRLY